MTATNSLGYCVEIYDRRIGWLRQSEIFATMEEAEVHLSKSPPDGFERRAYEAVDAQ